MRCTIKGKKPAKKCRYRVDDIKQIGKKKTSENYSAAVLGLAECSGQRDFTGGRLKATKERGRLLRTKKVKRTLKGDALKIFLFSTRWTPLISSTTDRRTIQERNWAKKRIRETQRQRNRGGSNPLSKEFIASDSADVQTGSLQESSRLAR